MHKIQAISHILNSSVFPIMFILSQPEAHAQSWSDVESLFVETPDIIQRGINRFFDQLLDQSGKLRGDIETFPRKVQDEMQRLENLGETREKIEDEIHRLENVLRDQTHDFGNQIQGTQLSFDLNKYLNPVIMGSGAQLILKAIIANQLIGPIALAQFLDVELNLHMEVMDFLFITKYIESHMNRQGGLDCVRKINLNALSIDTDIRICLEDNLRLNYATSIIGATPQAAALLAEYDAEMTRRIVEIGKALDSRHAAMQSAIGLNSAMSAATTQMLRALACNPNDSQCL